jgi:DNA-binding PadR family transcriptional regulator
MSLNGAELHILLGLGSESKHGYAIMQAIAEESDGHLKILPGTLYSTLKKLVAEGLIEEVDPPSTTDSDDSRRRYYRVTKRGRSVAQAEMSRLAVLVKMGRVFLREARR